MPAVKTLSEELIRGIPPGTWVAISEDQERVVATGETIDGVLQKAREGGEPHPFVIRVAEKNSALIL
jgi:hypothetical protein